MINLLPPDLKEQYVYGRRNVTLRRWAAALFAGLIGVVVVTFGGLLVMQKSINSYQGQVADTQDVLNREDLDGTRKDAKAITSNVKLAVDVLSKEILFSKLLKQIGTVTPPNVSLTELSISSDVNALDLKAMASDYSSATQLQVNLQDPANKIFTRADIQSIICSASSSDPRYPCTITLKALLNPDTPFKFISKGSDK